MIGRFIDTFRFRLKKQHLTETNNIRFITTIFGAVRVLDTGGDKPVFLTVPDGPNVMEHHEELIYNLSDKYSVICFELPGIGFSYPNNKYDYSFPKAAQLIINLLDILKIEKAILAFSCSNGFYAIKIAELFPQRVIWLFLSQTLSLKAMQKWTDTAIPIVLKIPLVGQIANGFLEKKFAKLWYKCIA